MNLFNSTRFLTLSLTMTVAGCNSVIAQDNINENNFIHYTKQQGLSHATVTGLAQDSAGYIWVATASGLNQFNGSSFIQFHSGNDSLSLPQEKLTGLIWLGKQRLAVYTQGGLQIIDTRTGEKRNLFISYRDKQFQFKFNEIRSITSNEAGDIFLLTYSGFYHYDKNYQLVFRFDYYPEATTGFAFGRKLLWVGGQQLAIISIAGIYYYNERKKEFKKMDAACCPFLQEFSDYPKKNYQFFQPYPDCIFTMSPDKDSLVYFNLHDHKRIATHLPSRVHVNEFDYRSNLIAIGDSLLYLTGSLSGFYKIKLNTESGKIEFYPEKYFPSYYCQAIMEDRDHNLWIATNNGLFSQDSRRSFIQQSEIPAPLQTLFPNIVLQDIHATGNKLYAATRGGGGLLISDQHKLQFIRQLGFEKIWRSPNSIYSLAAIDDHNLLIATNGPLCLFNTYTDRITTISLEKWDSVTGWIADLHKDRKDNIWIAAEKLYKRDAKTQQFSLVPANGIPLSKLVWPKTIQEDPAGNIWIAGHGLIRYNTTTSTFDRFIDSFPFIKFPEKQVNSFIADHQNNLWINSNNNGLIRYNIDKGESRQFTRNDGLPDNNIAAMTIIGNKLWLATFSGIACLDLQTLQITGFGKEDGFPDQPIGLGAKLFYDSLEKKLYAGFTNTIVRFDPNIIFQKIQAPKVFIESITAGDQKKIIYPGEKFSSSWRNNEMLISIGSINFFTSSSQRFAYRIAKDDSTRWQLLGTQNTFSISNLASGHHRIQVKLFSLNNRWPEQVKEIEITITPPFWEQVWFITASLLLLLLFLYLLLKWRTGTIRKKERAKTDIQKLIAEEYKNQFELEQISNYFSSSLADKKNVDEVLWDVTKNLIGRMNYAECIIYMWNTDKTRMIQKAAYGPKGSPKAISSQLFDVLPGQGIVGHVMQFKEPVLVPDTRKDDRYRVDDMLRLCELCVPIIHNGELIGIIDSEHPDESHFKERDIKILSTIATLIANKIKQIESEQSLEIKLREIIFINQQLAEAQLSALQTQMNPHFIFNSLNSIKGMILSNERQRASRYLSKFAHMIRITLNQSKETFTTLHENVEYLESYLLMEKLRFDDSFTYQITVEDEIDKEEIFIPTMMIQPLAENAIWHGLMHKEGEKNLEIRFSMQGEAISCAIKDNGIGIKQSEELKAVSRPLHKSVGLNNLRNRINIMNEKYQADCTLEITDIKDFNKSGTGTLAVLRFNIINPDLL